jgi:hypothetical protein
MRDACEPALLVNGAAAPQGRQLIAQAQTRHDPGILQAAGIEFTVPCQAQIDGVNVAGRPA